MTRDPTKLLSPGDFITSAVPVIYPIPKVTRPTTGVIQYVTALQSIRKISSLLKNFPDQVLDRSETKQRDSSDKG